MWVNTRHYSVQLLVNTRHLTKILKIVREKKQHEALLHYAAVQLWVNTRHLTLAWHFTRTTCLLVIMRWKYQLFHKPGKPHKNICRLSVMVFCRHFGMRVWICHHPRHPKLFKGESTWLLLLSFFLSETIWKIYSCSKGEESDQRVRQLQELITTDGFKRRRTENGERRRKDHYCVVVC